MLPIQELSSCFHLSELGMFLISPWPVTSPLFGVGNTPNFMMLKLSMSVNVEVPLSMKDNKMNDTKGV